MFAERRQSNQSTGRKVIGREERESAGSFDSSSANYLLFVSRRVFPIAASINEIQSRERGISFRKSERNSVKSVFGHLFLSTNGASTPVAVESLAMALHPLAPKKSWPDIFQNDSVGRRLLKHMSDPGSHQACTHHHRSYLSLCRGLTGPDSSSGGSFNLLGSFPLKEKYSNQVFARSPPSELVR